MVSPIPVCVCLVTLLCYHLSFGGDTMSKPSLKLIQTFNEIMRELPTPSDEVPMYLRFWHSSISTPVVTDNG